YDAKRDMDLTDWVLAVCRANEIEIVIPPEESSALLLAREAARLKQDGITVASLPIAALEKTIDKTKTIAAARGIGVRIPPTEIPGNNAQIFASAQTLEYPVVIKPRCTRFWHGEHFIDSTGVAYANSDEQLRRLMRQLDPRMPPPIVQKFIPGEGVGV